LNNSDIES